MLRKRSIRPSLKDPESCRARHYGPASAFTICTLINSISSHDMLFNLGSAAMAFVHVMHTILKLVKFTSCMRLESHLTAHSVTFEAMRKPLQEISRAPVACRLQS